MIRGIPATLTPNRLEQYVQSAAKTGFVMRFVRKPEVCACEILRIIDKDTNEAEVFGLVSVRPRKAALETIERINKTRLRGRAVVAREFFIRAYQRDRRDTLARKKQVEPGKDRRKGDRRRNVIIEKVSSPRVEVAY